MNIERLSLDQLRVFQLVADMGSFSAAARKLLRAQSAVSYTIATLETQLDLVLFDRSSYRPQLTRAGKSLLPEVRALLARIDRLEGQAQMLAGGIEPEVSLIVDGAFPLAQITKPLQRFSQVYPDVSLRIVSASMNDVVIKLSSGAGHLGIVSTLPELPPGYEAFALNPVRHIPVAARSHPLGRTAGVISHEELCEHLQIVLSERGPQAATTPEYGVVASKTWRVSDLSIKRELLRAGLGWGAMPSHLVDEDIANGDLVRLATAYFPAQGDVLPSWCLHSSSQRLGPAAAALLDLLRSHIEANLADSQETSADEPRRKEETETSD